MARKLGKEGKVVLRLALDAQGQLQGIDIVEANGFGFAEAASLPSKSRSLRRQSETVEPYHHGFLSQ